MDDEFRRKVRRRVGDDVRRLELLRFEKVDAGLAVAAVGQVRRDHTIAMFEKHFGKRAIAASGLPNARADEALAAEKRNDGISRSGVKVIVRAMHRRSVGRATARRIG